MKKLFASVGLAAAAVSLAGLAACGSSGYGNSGAGAPAGSAPTQSTPQSVSGAQAIMNAETNPQYEEDGPVSNALLVPFPAGDVSSSATGVSVSTSANINANNVYQVVAVLTPAGLKDPALKAQENAMQAGGNNVTGATVTVSGDVLTVTSSANSVTPLPFQNLGVLEP